MKALHQLPAPAPSPRKPLLARRLLLLALTLGAVPALAQRMPHRRHEKNQPPQSTLIPGDTIRQVVELPAATLDSLAVEPLEAPAVDSAQLAWLQTPATLYETVNDRMGCIETQAPHQFNNAVMAYVRLFTERQRGYTQRVLEREQFYFPTFEKYLAQYNLPLELKYLAVVESALIPTAKSPVGAVGLWQFMPPTAGDLRLKRDEYVDERMHPEKATEGACKHLRYLYGVFHDWELVLAAYNWGAGNMQRVMRKTGKRTFWELYPHLPAETRNYVPTFTAIMYAMKYADAHRLNDPALRYQRYEALDTLTLRGQALDLRRLSRALGYEDSLTLGRYNPEVRHGGLPAGYRPYVLRYPSAAREHLGDVDRATLIAYCQPTTDLPQPLPSRQVWPTGAAPWPSRDALAATSGPRASAAEAAPRTRRVHYTVRRGQTLATVAEKFEVSQTQLRRWNDLPKQTTLRPGRDLVVFVPLPPVLAPAPTVAASPVLASAPRRVVPVDSATLALAAANARYAREAQALAQREATQAQALLRAQKQQAARVAAAQQRAIFQAAALAKAAAAQEKAQRLAAEVAASPAPTPEAGEADADTVAAPVPTPARRTRSRGLAVAVAPREVVEPEVIVAAKPAPAPPAKSDWYTVRPGDDLTHLARARGLTVAQLRAWNQLPNESVLAGQRLRLSAPAAAEVVVAAAPARPARAAALERPEPQFSTHTVQAGDTLYNISRRFKVSVQELRRLNHLTSDDVKLGQKLVVQAS
jgi:membrane-bound lytic murein transglycosylase D